VDAPTDIVKSPGTLQAEAGIPECSSAIGDSAIKNDLLLRRFSSFESGMLPFVQSIAAKSGCSIARAGTHKMDTDRARQLFDKDDVVQRGRFYCKSGKDTCTFNAAFTFDFAKQEYHFKANGLNLEHNHASTALTIDGVRVKTRGCELSAEERSSISDLSPF